MKLSPTFTILAAFAIHGCLAYPQFADQIPNGKAVPNPNPQGGVWAGVGHLKAGGGGPLNPFGEAFRANQYSWTDELCQADSDGDGRTNGVELGDPNCVWFAGGPEPEAPALSHPGIVDEPQKVPPTTSCSDHVEPNEVIEYDIGFSTPTFIDETRTHYICEQKEIAVPSSQVLHKIKESIILDNKEVLHHMFVFFCFNDSQDGNRVGEGPYECSGNESRCTRVGMWAVGPEESCMPPYIGVEYDFTGMENVVVKIEAHYDNSSGRSHQDQSGIRLFLTPELRPLSAETAILGVMTQDKNFEIPPQQQEYPLTNVCPGEATLNLPHPIYIYAFGPHMHLFGHTLYTDHYRCGEKIGEIGRINAYEFDNQQKYMLSEPVKVLPGDTLVTTCIYNSMSSNVSLVGGEETTDEMCLNFVEFYPALTEGSFRACTSFENGVDLEQMQSSQVAAFDGFDRVPSLGALQNVQFAIGPGEGIDSLVFNFEVDASSNLAQCCGPNSCEEDYLESIGGVCASDGDCKGDLVCLDGFCIQAPQSTEGNSSSNDNPIEGEDLIEGDDPIEEDVGVTSATKPFSVVVALIGIAANILLLNCFAIL